MSADQTTPLIKENEDIKSDDGSAAMAGLNLSPSLPSEVWGVVAELLASEHAFETMASLNVIDRDTHEETLPVLYETLLWDGPAYNAAPLKLLGNDASPPKGYLFTKFLTCRQTSLPDVKRLVEASSSPFPQLCMILCSGITCRYSLRPACSFHIFGRLQISIAFDTVGRTPVYHDATAGNPFKHVPDHVLEIMFSSHGQFLPDAEHRRSTVNKPVQMQGTCIHTSDSENAHCADSIVEIVKLLGQQESSPEVAEDLVSPLSYPPGLYRDCHIAMLLHRKEVQALIDKLILVAPSFPEVVYGHLKFFVYEAPSQELIETSLRRLQEVQQAQIVTRRPVPSCNTCVYSISGVGTLAYEDDWVWPTVFGDQALARDVGYYGQLMLFANPEGLRLGMTLKSPETFFDEMLDEEREMALEVEDFARAGFDYDYEFDDYSGLGQYYDHWSERF